jgi:hypothetical protein
MDDEGCLVQRFPFTSFGLTKNYESIIIKTKMMMKSTLLFGYKKVSSIFCNDE